MLEAITYSLINMSIWFLWVLRIVKTPFEEIGVWELMGAILFICFASPVLLALAWYWLRASVLHTRLKMDHPTPRGWDHFVRSYHEYWVLFHWKNGKVSGGYFGEHSLAATFPHDPELYVEEMWRVDERGEFVEKVENTLGAVIRLNECERVEFLSVERGEISNGPDSQKLPGIRSAVAGEQSGSATGGANGQTGSIERCPDTPEGRLVNGTPKEPIQVTATETCQ